jgi:hypothetical protein
MKANLGCFVIIGADGEPTVASGLYSDKPLEKRKARGASDAPGGADSGAGEALAPVRHPSRCRRSWSRNSPSSAATSWRSISRPIRRSRSIT